MNALMNRIKRIQATRRGHRGRLFLTTDYHGPQDDEALAAHQARVRKLEAEGFTVVSIIREHGPQGISPEPGDIRIQRAYL